MAVDLMDGERMRATIAIGLLFIALAGCYLPEAREAQGIAEGAGDCGRSVNLGG